MAALEDVEIVANLYRLAGTGNIHCVDELKSHAQDLMPEVGAEQFARAMRELATRLWDSNHRGFRDEYLHGRGHGRGRRRLANPKLAVSTEVATNK